MPISHSQMSRVIKKNSGITILNKTQIKGLNIKDKESSTALRKNNAAKEYLIKP